MEKEEELLSLLQSSSSEEDDERLRSGKRNVCYNGCGRPSVVCICPYLPSRPIQTSTQIILLHHPHALKNNPTNTISTIPPLISSLLNLSPISARKLRLGSHPLLDSLYNNNNNSSAAVFLFPSLPSSPLPLPLPLWVHQIHPATRSNPILIAFDGTWTQAREMATASLPFLSKFAKHVTIGDDLDEGAEGPSTYESELVVRKEPFQGCVSTMEAVARALRVMEPDERVGAEVETTLIGILKAMVRFQAVHLKPDIKPRIKMMSKKKKRRERLQDHAGHERP